MTNVLGDARVRDLLHALDDASRLRSDTRQAPEGLADTVNDLERDLGRRVYELYRLVLADPAPADAEPTAELPAIVEPDDHNRPPGFALTDEVERSDEAPRETWYTDEVGWEADPEPIFDANELDAVEPGDIGQLDTVVASIEDRDTESPEKGLRPTDS